MKRPAFIFLFLAIMTASIVCFAIFYVSMAGVQLYDYNFDAFHRFLSQDQSNAIIQTAHQQLLVLVYLLVFSSFAWIAFAVYMLKKLRLANQPLQLPDAASVRSGTFGL